MQKTSFGGKVSKILKRCIQSVGKKWLFWFCEALALCVGAKPNVPLVRLAKIVFKKCAVEKNKNTEALAFGSAVCLFNCPVTLCLFLSFILAVSSFRLAGNGKSICEGRAKFN